MIGYSWFINGDHNLLVTLEMIIDDWWLIADCWLFIKNLFDNSSHQITIIRRASSKTARGFYLNSAATQYHSVRLNYKKKRFHLPAEEWLFIGRGKRTRDKYFKAGLYYATLRSSPSPRLVSLFFAPLNCFPRFVSVPPPFHFVRPFDRGLQLPWTWNFAEERIGWNKNISEENSVKPSTDQLFFFH